MGTKKPPDYGQEVTQMFSQRNNPYCELLSITNLKIIFLICLWFSVIFDKKFFLNLKDSNKLDNYEKKYTWIGPGNEFYWMAVGIKKRLP